MNTELSHSVGDTAAIAEKILSTLAPQQSAKGATMLALSGDLGSGKTTFVQQVAKVLGVQGAITSPTFVIIQSYPVSYKGFEKLIHVDAYRLDSSEELQKLHWQEYLDDAKNLICLEWPERVPDCIPQNALKLQLTFIDETTRSIKLYEK